VRRSGGEEPTWVLIHILQKRSPNDPHMKWHGNNTISLYSYLSLSQTSKNTDLIIAYILSSTISKNKRAEKDLPGSVSGGSMRGEVTPSCVYTCE
jgi:hypothetical protein